MKLRLLWVGRTQEAWVKTGIEEYAGRVKRYSPFELAEVKEEKGGLPEQMRQRESERIEKLLPKNGKLILLENPEDIDRKVSMAKRVPLSEAGVHSNRTLASIVGTIIALMGEERKRSK